jgi:hypothetical protein
MSSPREAQMIVLLGHLRRAGQAGCTVEWLARRVNRGRLDIERALGGEITAGRICEQGGVYRMREVPRA